MVPHYALNYGFHTFPNLLKNLLDRHVALFIYKEVFQQSRERMEAIVNDMVSDHWSTVI